MKCLRGPNTLPLSLNHFIVYLLCTCRRCGTQGGAVFTKMVIGDPSRMMIRFDSVKHRNEPAGKGFSITVEAYVSGEAYCWVEVILANCMVVLFYEGLSKSS